MSRLGSHNGFYVSHSCLPKALGRYVVLEADGGSVASVVNILKAERRIQLYLIPPNFSCSIRILSSKDRSTSGGLSGFFCAGGSFSLWGFTLTAAMGGDLGFGGRGLADGGRLLKVWDLAAFWAGLGLTAASAA